MNKEYYLLRSMFEERFPSAAALNTVPKGLSIACSTPEAVSWDPEWANIHDISGRAVSFHDASEEYETAEMASSADALPANGNGNGAAAAFNGAANPPVVTILDSAAPSMNGNGAKKEPRTVAPSAMHTMHVAQPRARATRCTTLSASKGLRVMRL